MSFSETIAKQLAAYPIFKKQARIGYYEEKPLKQIHMDTMFFQVANLKDAPKIPILCIVDVATRFTKYYVQVRKNESIKMFLGDFIKSVKEKFDSTSSEMILVTDGAPEFKKIHGEVENVSVKLHVSTGINKAVLAEVSIRKARAILRSIELNINVDNIQNGTENRIDSTNIKEFMEKIQDVINLKAKLRKPKPKVGFKPSTFEIGDPVFAINFYKFYPFQMKSQMTKASYKNNWYFEPFKVVKKYCINGVYKYTLAPFTDTTKELKYHFYDDQLQKIDYRYVSVYISAYRFNQEMIEK